MRALFFKDKLQFLTDYPVPKPKYNEALIRVSMAGICGTDLEITQQTHIRPRDRVCVLGDGRLGLLAAQALSLTGCTLFVAGRYRKKLDILEQRGIRTSNTEHRKKE